MSYLALSWFLLTKSRTEDSNFQIVYPPNTGKTHVGLVYKPTLNINIGSKDTTNLVCVEVIWALQICQLDRDLK
jgi:hypothetical protein